MAQVSKEGNNTDKMVNHQLLKKRHYNETLKHNETDLITATDLLDTCVSDIYNSSASFGTAAEFFQNPSYGDAMGSEGRKTIVSDTDNQLLIKYRFKERVNITGMRLHFKDPPTPTEDETVESYAPPGKIKLYVNQDSLDFGDLDATEPIFSLDKPETGKFFSVPAHKSQRVDTLYLFIEEGAPEDAPFTFLNQCEVIGYPSVDYHSNYR